MRQKSPMLYRSSKAINQGNTSTIKRIQRTNRTEPLKKKTNKSPTCIIENNCHIHDSVKTFKKQ